MRVRAVIERLVNRAGRRPRASKSSSRASIPHLPRCRAPWASLYLDPRGEVKVCCQNEWVRLGNVQDHRLVDIWRGPAMRALRQRVLAGDLSMGCEMCALSVERGQEDSAYFRVFERLSLPDGEPLWPTQLELALSNTCNLQCAMCNGELSSAIRVRREGRQPLPPAYGAEFFEELDRFLPHLESIVFLGGEPFLARESLQVMDRLIELGLGPSCSVTTNGTQWSPRIERIVKELPMHVTVSVDGATAATLEGVRVGARFDHLVENIGRFSDALRSSQGTMSLAFCLMATNAHEFGDVLRWGDELDVDVVVNAVHHPPHLSLAHRSAEELDRIIDALEAQSPRREAELGRNLDVWSREIASLRAMRDQRHGAEVPVDLPAAGGEARARRRLEAQIAGDQPAAVRANEHQVVTEVVAGAEVRFGVRLEELVRSPLWQLVTMLTQALGVAERTHVARHDDGVEERLVVFSRGERRITMRATMSVRRDGGPTWFLHFSEGSPGRAASDEAGSSTELPPGHR